MAPQSKLPSIADVVSLAVSLHQGGHLNEAETLYRQALDRAPDDVDALHFLGVLRHSQGDSKEAVRLIRMALRGNPRYLGARLNLGNVLKESERFAEAEAEYRNVLNADPRNAEAYNNLGAVLRACKKNEDAVVAFERAVELRPGFADGLQNLGNALKSVGRLEEALTAFRAAVEIDPRHGRANLSLGRALHTFGRTEEAAIVYRQWLKVDPENPIAEHMLAACGGNDAPDRCSEEFVRESFNVFADSFDEVLERLEYRAPALIEAAISECLPAAAGQWSVLDAGCGTGLCGKTLRPYATHLIGIDLSPKMLVKARSRELYDELIEEELADFMWNHPVEFDLIVSADTLVYFGALEQVFASAAKSLRPGGSFVFSVERDEQESEHAGYRLNPHGRYSHAESYVTECLSGASLTLRAINRATLRLENRIPVAGLVVVASKGS